MHIIQEKLPQLKGKYIARVSVLALFNLLLCFLAYGQENADQLRSNIKSASTDQQKVVAYKKLVRYFQLISHDSAIYYAQKGLDQFTADKNDAGRAAMLHSMGNTYDNEGLFDISKQKEEEALKIYTALNDKAGIANVQNALGVYQGRKGNYNEAIRLFMGSLAQFESLHDTAGIVSTYLKIGTANDQCGNNDKALEVYNAALDLCKNAPSVHNVIFLNTNIGVAYCRKNDFDKAIQYLQKALDLSNSPEFAHARVQPLMNMGKIYREKEDFKKALEYYGEALQIAKEDTLSEDYIILSVNIAVVTARTGNPDKAMASLETLLKTTKASGQKRLESIVIDGIIELSVFRNDYKTAFYRLNEEQDLLSSIYDLDKAKEIANLQAVHDLNRSNEQMNAIKESEQRNRKKKDIIIVIAIFLAGSVVAMLYLYRNSRILNYRLKKRTDELKNANDAKDRFFSVIGHDLNGAVLNMPALLELYRLDSTTEEERTMIIDSLEEASVISVEILENLLNWGKSQIKGITLNQSSFDASDIIENKIRLLRIAIRNKNITVVKKTLPGTNVYADVNHFTFIIRNLLSNAIKYTPNNGHIEVIASGSSMPGFMMFSVKDSGVGISPEKQKTIFEPFNISAPGTADEAGNSIGLLLCKQFVEANGGKIWVESKEGNGAKFCFTLKLSI